jgi:hypothetical protein
VRLCIAEARVLIACDLPMGFLGRWCCIMAEAVDGFHTLVVVGIEGVIFGCMAEVMGYGFFGDVAAQMEALASAPIGEGSQWCTRVL